MTVYYKVLAEDGSACHGGTGKWHLPKGKRPGKWMPEIGNVEACARGYHVVTLDQLIPWLGPALFEVEIAGEIVDAESKTVASRARLLRRVDTWNVRTERLFAADCALRALRAERKAGREPDPRSWAGAYAARKVANGQMSEDAARGAADAARDAAYAAQGAAYAARGAAYAAQGAAYAARDAAYAARGAAYAAWGAADAARGAADAAQGAADAARGAADAAQGAADAAWDAAYAARGAAYAAWGAADAARYAERRWQTRRLNEYLAGKRGGAA